MKEDNLKNIIPIKQRIRLFLERFNTNLASKFIKTNKKTDKVYTVSNIPYTKDKQNPLLQFDWHCPLNLACNRFYTKCPTLFYIHGGAWSAGDKSIFSILAKDFAENGLIVININYSLMPEKDFSATFNDVYNCIKFCLDNQNYLGIDNQKIFLGGDSAGAHLASLFCAKQTSKQLSLDCNILGAILFYGVYNLNNLENLKLNICKTLHTTFKTTKQDLQKFYTDFSTTTYLTPNFPPTFITAGKVDNLCQESEDLIQKLNSLNVPVTSLIFPKNRLDARHAFVNLHLKARQEALSFANTFIKEQLKNT